MVQIPNSQMNTVLLAVRVAMKVMEGTGPKYVATRQEIEGLYSHLADQVRLTLSDETEWRRMLHGAGNEAVGISNDFVSGILADGVMQQLGGGIAMVQTAPADETLTGKPEPKKRGGGGYSRAAYQRDMQAMYDLVGEKGAKGVPVWDQGKNVGQNVVAFLGWLAQEYPKYFEGGRHLTVGKALRLWASCHGVNTSVDKTNDVAEKYIKQHYPDVEIKKGRGTSA